MALFKSLVLRHDLTDPFTFEAQTNVFTYEVSFVMGDIIPCFTREPNFVLNLSLSDTGILCSGRITGGMLGSVSCTHMVDIPLNICFQCTQISFRTGQ